MTILALVRWELRQHLRDPLTLVFMVGMPLLLYPLVGMLGARVEAAREDREAARTVVVAVQGELPLPESARVLPTEDPRAEVEAGRSDIGVRVRSDGADVWYDSRDDAATAARERVDAALELVRVPQVVLVDEVPLERRTLDKAARTFPALLVVTLLLGGLYTALDVVTGEKERGTLETVLTTRVDRRNVFAAKLLVVLAFVLVIAAISSLASWASARWFADLDVPFGTALGGFLLFTPLAGLLAVILTVAAAWVPDFKTGQVLSIPLMLVPGVAASAAMFPGVELTWAWALVPISNLAIALRDLVMGRVDAGPLALTLLASAGWAVGAAAVGARLLGREDVLLGTRGSAQRRQRGDYLADAAVAYAIGLLLLWFVGQAAQTWDILWGLVLTQVGLFIPLALVTVVVVGLPIRETLSWRAPRGRDLAWSVVVGVCLPGVGLGVQVLQDPFLRAPAGLFEGFVPEGATVPVVLATYALLPAVCEELLFRGAGLGLLRRGGRPYVAVLLCALAFGLFHLSIFRLAPTAALGLLMGVILVRSGSIVCSMVAHALNNGLLMLAWFYWPDLQPGWGVPLLAAGAVGAAAMVGRGRPDASQPAT